MKLYWWHDSSVNNNPACGTKNRFTLSGNVEWPAQMSVGFRSAEPAHAYLASKPVSDSGFEAIRCGKLISESGIAQVAKELLENRCQTPVLKGMLENQCQTPVLEQQVSDTELGGGGRGAAGWRRGEGQALAVRLAGWAALWATPARNSAMKAASSSSSPSWMSRARRVLPSRLALNRPVGSGSAAPLAKVSLTAFL